MTRYALVPLAVLSLAACGERGKAGPNREIAAAPATPAPPARDFNAVGTEPFWAVEARGDSLTLSRPDYAEVRVATSGPQARGEALVWTSESVTVSIRTRACSDGMSDRRYLYEAEVRVGREVLKGCAYEPGAIPTAAPGS